MPSRHLPVLQPGAASLPAAEGPPPFQRIGIVGLGLVGGSIALACRHVWPSSLVIGVDRNDVLERAMVRHAMDVAADDLFVLADADLVVLAAPVERNNEILAALPKVLTGAPIVTDVGSTKRTTAETARRAAPELVFVGGHPMAGAARSGIEYATADLFQGRPWILTSDDGTPAEAVGRMTAFVEALGARSRVMTPAAHDHLAAYLSHLPQVVASALMVAIGEELRDDGLSLAGRGLVDTTRLASSPPSVWAGICSSNADEIAAAIDGLIGLLDRIRGGLADRATVTEVFDAASAWRSRLTSVQPARPRDPGDAAG